ncbi:MAG: hypothetical protein K2X44_07545 [Magnetospirillum sp.]|nr:hypothetical protein [Magnetospirillum sp.]
MTFDFAPHWMDIISTATPYSGEAPKPAVSSPLQPPCAPASPSMTEVAALVEELFAEGTLSYDQLRSLSTAPELASLLAGALDSVPAGRRVGHSRK